MQAGTAAELLCSHNKDSIQSYGNSRGMISEMQAEESERGQSFYSGSRKMLLDMICSKKEVGTQRQFSLIHNTPEKHWLTVLTPALHEAGV